MATAETTSLSMDLIIDTANQRVLFAEASRDVVYYLHSLLDGMPDAFAESATLDGCVDNIAESVVDLLEIRAPLSSAKKKRFFECGYKRGAGCASYVAMARGARCPSCGLEMAAEVEVPPDSPGAGGSGEVVMCLLNDDLTVTPVVASRLERARRRMARVMMGVTGATELETRTVQLGYTDGLAILETSLQSDTVLTDVFLGNKDFPSCKKPKHGD